MPLTFYLCGLKLSESQFTETLLLGWSRWSISCTDFSYQKAELTFDLVIFIS